MKLHFSCRRARILLIALASVILIVAATVLAVCFRERISLWWSELKKEPIAMTAVEVECESVLISELSADPRATFNQSLMLINTSHMLSDDFVADLAEYKTSTVMMNTCILEAYAALSAAVKEHTGDKLYVSSSVRTRAEQEELYREDPTTATLPGASEHETGLSLDVYVAYYAGDGFLQSEAGAFVNRSCQEYGFIIRYPRWGEEQTGIRFEPWHIRYVGQPHARVMTANRWTLEEYIDALKEGVFYRIEDFLVLRQAPKDGSLFIPTGGDKVVVSPDNTGCYIVTIEGYFSEKK